MGIRTQTSASSLDYIVYPSETSHSLLDTTWEGYVQADTLDHLTIQYHWIIFHFSWYSETPVSVASESVVTSVSVAKVTGQNPSIHNMTNYLSVARKSWNLGMCRYKTLENNYFSCVFQIIVMLVVILVVFMVCWLPLQVCILYSEFTKRIEDNVSKYYYCLLNTTNSSQSKLNKKRPSIYLLVSNRKFEKNKR